MRTGFAILTAAPLTLALAAAAPRSEQASSPATAKSCINSTRLVSRRAVAPQVLELSLAGGQVYRSRLSRPCPHLDELDRTYILQFEQQQGTQVCAGDRFRVIDPVVARAGGVGSFPLCASGGSSR